MPGDRHLWQYYAPLIEVCVPLSHRPAPMLPANAVVMPIKGRSDPKAATRLAEAFIGQQQVAIKGPQANGEPIGGFAAA